MRSQLKDPTLRFRRTAEQRNAASSQKDAVIVPILRSLPIDDPARFNAVLMPSLYGPESEILIERGVPESNIFVVERDLPTYRVLQKTRDYTLPYRPLPDYEALDDLWGQARARGLQGFDLVYLDFFSQPGHRHLEMLHRMFKLKMVLPSGTLLLTFGNTRCRVWVKWLANVFTRDSSARVPTERYIRMVAEAVGHPLPTVLKSHEYTSQTGKRRIYYVTTEVRWSA